VEQVEVSELPHARPNQSEALYRPGATVLYRALVAAGEAGLAWRDCYTLLLGVDLSEGQQAGAVGRHVVWMRSRGVRLYAYYEAGETRFRLEEPDA
jgi:hypothetical protein